MMIEVAKISVLIILLLRACLDGRRGEVSKKKEMGGSNRPYTDIGERFGGIWSLFYPFKPLSFSCPKLGEFGMGEKRRGYTYIQNFNFSIDFALIMSFYLFFEVGKKHHYFQFI